MTTTISLAGVSAGSRHTVVVPFPTNGKEFDAIDAGAVLDPVFTALDVAHATSISNGASS